MKQYGDNSTGGQDCSCAEYSVVTVGQSKRRKVEYQCYRIQNNRKDVRSEAGGKVAVILFMLMKKRCGKGLLVQMEDFG